ncbi:Binding-protein-dependent transport system inner membrane component [uncultured archaeon]|nr:Binding-protein-dependent transport system inner membrane component [uncultured archaeon]
MNFRFHKLLLPLSLILLWQVLALYISNPFVLPNIGAVLSVLLRPTADILGSGSLIDNAMMSLFRVALGFLIASCLAVPLGLAMGHWEAARDVAGGLISALRPVPPLAWVPLAMAWLKIGLLSILFIIALGAFFPILLSTAQGVLGVKRSWMEAVSMMGARESDLIRSVILPGSAPEIWNGMRVGFGIAWMCVVAAEMLPGTSSGLGYLIMYAYGWGQIQVVVAGMVAIGIIGILIDQLFIAVERRWFSWRSYDR